MLLDRVVAGVTRRSETPLTPLAAAARPRSRVHRLAGAGCTPAVVRALAEHGASQSPWIHQAAAADLAAAGKHVVVATGTASGKSLAYQLPC